MYIRPAGGTNTPSQKVKYYQQRYGGDEREEDT